MKVNKGDFVRDNKGNIVKCDGIIDFERDNPTLYLSYGLVLISNPFHIDQDVSYTRYSEIVKTAAPDDRYKLIEVGDYVNGNKVINVSNNYIQTTNVGYYIYITDSLFVITKEKYEKAEIEL